MLRESAQSGRGIHAGLSGVMAVLALVGVLSSTPVFAQSQSINGTIAGTVTDASGGALPGVSVTVTNIDDGTVRVVVSNESGLYRAQLLPLGAYKVSAELEGFKKFEQLNIALSAGQTQTINVTLEIGAMTEVVSVTAAPPVVDVAQIQQGRLLNNAEIKTLPLTSRNPYNFALLQPGVTGFETNEFGVPRLTSNGALLRVNYQIDGSNNTQKDRAGLRQMPMSEVMIREVKVVTTGYAPEFGQTMGLIYNAITPSGTNNFRGQASYRMQRKSMVAFPFFFSGPRNDDTKPPTEVNIITVDAGGPIIMNKTHFFGGFENTKRDLSGSSVITIPTATASLLGIPDAKFQDRVANAKFGIGKIDHQLTNAHRLSVRYIYFDQTITNNVGGGITSVERGTDFNDRQNSTAAQLVSTFGSSLLNELRVQYATRAQSRVPGAQAGTGPAILVTGVAAFGGPVAASSDAGFGFSQDVFQVSNNVSYMTGRHSFKIGFDGQHVADARKSTAIQLYTFPTTAAYLAAKNGTNRFGYSQFTQYFGEPGLEYSSNLYGAFIQDDWQITSNLKLLYGVRYDVYDLPTPDSSAPYSTSRDFTVDKNNWGPRAGLAWTFGPGRRSVLRANSGLMYDQALLAVYEQALQNDGTNKRASATFSPTQAGAPAFPSVLSAGAGATPNTVATVDPEFRTARTFQNNIQFETAVFKHYAVGIGASYVKGNNLPVITNVNLANPISVLADGRPVFGAASAATRVDPRYNVVNMVQSLGDSTYKNITLQLTRRQHNGFQFDFAYTLGKSEDTAPITGTLSVQGDAGRSDPTNLDFDKGPNVLDQRHAFTGSVVIEPKIKTDNALIAALVNGNRLGILMQLASGIPINVRSNRELNGDATASDRPIGVTRNSLNLPARKNLDLRISRVVPIGPAKAEVIAEFKNVFNTVQWSGVTATVTTDTLGNPLAPIPTDGKGFTPTSGYEQRQFQLGFRVSF